MNKRNFRILLVDDDETELELISYAIGDMDPACPVDTANNGMEALDYLYRRGKFAQREEGQPVLVILDNKMPIMSGIEATLLIRAMENPLQRTPIIAVTANAMEADKEACRLAGMDAHLSKPLQALELQNMLAQFCTAK